MRKIIFPLFTALMFLGFSNTETIFTVAKAEENTYLLDFNYEEVNGHLEVKSVIDSSKNKTHLRVYGEKNGLLITSINSSCFEGCDSLESLMISSKIEQLTPDTLDINGLTSIYYTGSSEEWTALNYQTLVNVYYYSFDEGFINYWNTYIRPNSQSSICEISNETYNQLIKMYEALGLRDKNVVDEYEDLGGEKIGDSIKYLNTYFSPEEPASKNTEIDKTTTLSIVVGIAVFGMTSIAIFYLLMKKNIIS